MIIKIVFTCWLTSDDIAPEELEIPDQVNFGGSILSSNTREDIINDYYALLKTNLNPDFVAALSPNYYFWRVS
jgi:hypothetical protein